MTEILIAAVAFDAHHADRLAQLAHDLKRRSVSGSSAEMLGRMRLFYRAFPQLRAQFPSSVTTECRRLAGCRYIEPDG